MKKTTSLIIVAALAGILGNPFIVSARAQDSTDSFLAANNDANLSDAERFALAKEGLTQALSLSVDKVDELTANLEGYFFEKGSRESELKQSFLDKLSAYRAYYSEKDLEAEELDTLEGVQALAKEVRNYRDEVYTPDAEKIVQFTLIFHTEELISLAKDRAQKISADVDKLEMLGFIEDGTFDGQLNDVASLLTEAEDLRNQAKEAALALPEDGSATTTATTSDEIEVSTSTVGAVATNIETASSTATTNEETPTEEMQAYEQQQPLEKSLNDIKAVYGIFLDISGSVRATLGIE